jgi:CRP-like cAMP-binding protein
VIVRGRVDVTRRAADGADRHVSVLEDGDFFGEIALLDEVRRTATVRARTPCLLLGLDRGDFRELLSEVPVLREVFERVARARRAELRDEFPSLPFPERRHYDRDPGGADRTGVQPEAAPGSPRRSPGPRRPLRRVG